MGRCPLLRGEPFQPDMKKPRDPKESIRLGIIPAAYVMLGWILVVVISAVILFLFRWFI